ncbi:MAG: N-acetyltransferase [Limibacillus sp.]
MSAAAPEGPEIRDGGRGDWPALETLYAEAFPDEDLLPLIRELLREGPTVTSLVAAEGGDISGHLLLTACALEEDRGARLSLLGPLAVLPARQRQGIGGSLLRFALARLAAQGFSRALLLGDPAYYRRFGFAPEQGVSTPYPLPPDWAQAWQSLALEDGARAPAGRLQVPPAWAKPALWQP